jgi:hypothetical protein
LAYIGETCIHIYHQTASVTIILRYLRYYAPRGGAEGTYGTPS